MCKKVLAVPDLHLPFIDLDALIWVYDLVRTLKPDVVVQLGDLFDFYAKSKFPRSHNVMTPSDEIWDARKKAERFWENIQKINPNIKCYQLLGNHDIRPLKRAAEKAPELEVMLNIGHYEIFKFQGVETYWDLRIPLAIDDCLYMHGHTKHGMHARRFLANVIHGHDHFLGISYHRIYNGLDDTSRSFFEASAGYLADPDSKPMTYTTDKTYNWTKGAIFRNSQGVPIAIPYVEKPRTTLLS